jgi:hypothetical protein
LDLAATGVAVDSKGQLREKFAIKLDGIPGVEVKVDSPQAGRVSARVFLAGRRWYQVMVAVPPAKVFSNEGRQFLDSFRIQK